MFKVVLVSPQIPPNTGNIIRLCSNTGCTLHIIEPMGFELCDSKLKRAGLDYAETVNIQSYSSMSNFYIANEAGHSFTFSKWHTKLYSEVNYQPADVLIFGSETSGLPQEIRNSVIPEHRVMIPMFPNNRSLNLSNAVAIAVYEAWRQQAFKNKSEVPV